MTKRVHTVFSVASALVVVATVVWGAVLVGSPGTARLQRFDGQRLRDLRTISCEIQSLCHDPDIKDELRRPLPVSLEELVMLARFERIQLSDPETGQPYGYTVKSNTTYEVCARSLCHGTRTLGSSGITPRADTASRSTLSIHRRSIGGLWAPKHRLVAQRRLNVDRTDHNLGRGMAQKLCEAIYS